MKITAGDCFVYRIHPDRGNYGLKITMPDRSGNYLHSGEFGLTTALQYRELLINKSITGKNTIVRTHDKHPTYYQILVDITLKTIDNVKTLTFHSRALNLIDVQFEYRLLVTD